MQRFGLGYDIRESPTRLPETWEEKRRNIFLILPSVAAPLSLDPNVWTSIFYYDEATFQESEADVLARSPSRHYGIHRMFEFSDEMFAIAEANTRLGKFHWPVAVEILAESRSVVDEWLNFSMTGPCELDLKDALFLGFDVTDGGHNSALMNMGYTDDDIAVYRPLFMDKLNGNHLFVDLEDALLFRKMSPERSQLHAPYFVVALHRIPFPKI